MKLQIQAASMHQGVAGKAVPRPPEDEFEGAEIHIPELPPISRAPSSPVKAVSAPAAAQPEAPQPATTATPAPRVLPKGPRAPMTHGRKGHIPSWMNAMQVVEAALFSAGKPIAVEQVAEETGIDSKAVTKAMKDLAAAYAERDTVLEVAKAGTKWAMQVKSKAAEPAARFAAMEIAPKLLKTLALIAYHQPMKQSELVEMIGTKVYDHIPELIERGLVKAREEGSTKLLSTTAQFPEYFGLDAATPEEIRQTMGRLVGIEAPPKKKEESKQAEIAPTPATALPDAEGAGQVQSE